MSAEPNRSSAETRPPVYDPIARPELFDGVLSRRIFAFMIDVIIIGLPVVAASIFIFILGIVTLGLGFILFWPLHALTMIWALLYYGFTMGGPSSATFGMRMMDLEIRTWYGAPCTFVLGAVHGAFYWLSVTILTPLILLLGLFTSRRQLLHDLVLGTVVINNAERAARLSRR